MRVENTSVLSCDDLVTLAGLERPVLLVVVDTEEEFDWGSFSRAATSVSAIAHVDVGQAVLDWFGARPTYVIDYPVASQREGYELLREIARDGRATIGAHLHPWVTPPFEEEVSPRNSYANNLDLDLQRRKLRALTDKIAENFGSRPRVYKAGRYGVGPGTPELLAELGYVVDLSVSPGSDHRGDGGPDFTHFTAHPHWMDRGRRVLEFPCTGGFVGFLRPFAPRLNPVVQSAAMQRLRVPGILSRLGALTRLRLSPEGFAFPELKTLTRSLLRRGVRVLTLSFHSTSLKPGCTNYTRTHADLDGFLDTIRRYLEYFLGKLGGENMTPLELRARILNLTKEDE